MADESAEREPLLRVARIEVEGLFGLYSHRIELKLDERVTILHGPNGVGKTMLLRMVDFVLEGSWGGLRQVPFRTFDITFTDGTLLRIVRSAVRRRPRKAEVDVVLERPLGQPMLHRIDWAEFDEPKGYWQRIMPDGEVRPVMGSEWTEWEEAQIQRKSAEPDWLTRFRSHVDTHMIGVERLTHNSTQHEQTYTNRTVVRYADDLEERIAQVQAQYGRQSQVLDQSFPQRLIESSTMTDDLAALRANMETLDQKRAELTQIGLLDDTPQGPFKLASLDQIPPAQRNVMALYARDTSEKLAVFDDLAGRIKVLVDIINAKFRHKKLRVDREEGLVVEPAGYEGPPIELDALSSGEQHELVLHYDLLFRIRPNTLVLIDEPELSLHVVWQKRFLPDLLKIVAVAGIDVLVATHSPYIIGEHRDLMVGLSDDLP